MRLLHFDALGRLVLKDFRGKTIPPYAILSHRWSDSEILIEDISNRTYKEKEEGYRKLQFCAEQAAQDELQYFWIDTCCIDRWNNNELSKAINSMFQWYKNAARCYVFLSDVSTPSATEPIQRSDWEASFRASAWFTQGWTLQDLIAPMSVEFFSWEGRRIGDKASLDQLIHEITGIPLRALRNCPLDEFTTSERERWAENRRTKEEEDIVYCLLGILGVSMPTVHGEGRESAQRRLQAELEGARDAPSIIPFSQNPRFVGRESQLAELEAKLFGNDQTTTMLAIVGPGGTGKSQLALEVAHRTRQNNKGCSVFWIDASNKDSLYQSYADIAQKLDVPGWNDDRADMKQLVKRCVVKMSARQCLLIFDNVEHTPLRFSGSSTINATALADFLPQSKLCSVIFTTANTDTAQALASQNIIALRELILDAALKMLQVRLARPLANDEQQEAEHLLRELSYLPLAVMQAAACINASGMTVQEYRLQLDNHKELATEHSDDSSEDRLQDSGVKDPISATLFLSLNQISRDNKFAADCLFLAACVDQKDIPLNLLEAASMQAIEDAIKILNKYALVTRRPAESALGVHQLVHQAIRKRLQVQGRLTQQTQHAIIQLLRVFPDSDHSNRSKWRRLLPHAQYALSHSPADDDDEERLNLASKCAMALYSDGRYDEAEELQVQVMQTMKRVLTDEHPDTLTSMASLAATYREQGRWKEAEELEVQVLETRKRVLSDEHPYTLTSMSNLAATYRKQGRWKEAEELQMQAIETRKRVLTDEHPNTLSSMHNLALTYMNQGRWKEAEEVFLELVETRKRVLTDEHPDTLTSIASLAATYREQGRWKEAEELEVQVLETRKRVLSDEHPDTLTSMANLAATYSNQGRWKEAEELQVELIKKRKKALEEENPDTLTSMHEEVERMHRQTGATSEVTFYDSGIGTSIAQKSSKQLMGFTSEAFPDNMPAVQEVDEMYECQTTYTNDSIKQRTQTYEDDLAIELYRVLSLWTSSREDISRVSCSLPRLLQIFAYKIVKEGEDSGYRDTMRFMLKHRRSVAEKLAAKARESFKIPESAEVSEEVAESRKSPSMSYAEKVQSWNPSTGDIPDPNIPLEYEPGEAQADTRPTDEVQDIENEAWGMDEDEFSKTVTESQAYKWLLAKMRNELELASSTESAYPRLSESILRRINENQQFSRKSTPRRIDVVFNAEWTLRSFFKEQEYGVPPEEAVVKALVLIGTTTQAEGLACSEYLLRYWPESAPTFIRLVQSVAKSAEATSHDETLSDGTTLRASVKNGRFALKACGHPDSVIEIGEQLMWINCALRSSDFTQVGTCEPSFGKVLITDRSSSCVSMSIELMATPKPARLGESGSGACWQELFRNPLVVEGYPVAPRCSGPALGLQLSLSTLMALAMGSRLVSYMGKLFIKTFSTLLVAVKLVDNVILWHAVSNKDGSYIYYHDKRASMHSIEVTSSLLQEVDIVELKHVVGWTSTADNLAGTLACNYQIRLSGLASSRPLEIELEKLAVGFSKVFTGNASIKLGWRDKPIHARDGEDEKRNIKHISKHFVVLYDVRDHRGFLLDGATALLHLVRASIVEDQEDGLVRTLYNDRTINDSIQLDNHLDSRRRAMNTLWKDENASLKLYKRLVEGGTKTEVKRAFQAPENLETTAEEINSQRESWVFFKDRVTAIWWMLDQAINVQTDDTALKAELKNFMGNTKLEGYEFQDIASSNKADLQFTTPKFHSQGWLDLVRKLPAVTLFGRGFGEIIKHNDCAVDARPMCSDWNSVPTERGYLAISSSTLERVLERGGSEIWRLQNPFQPCKPEGQLCDRRHFLVNSRNKKAPKERLELSEHGALIIGHETSTMSRMIASIGGRQADDNNGTIATSRTTAESQDLQSTQSEDMSRPTVPSSAAENNHVRASTSSNTSVEITHNGLKNSIPMEPQRETEHLGVVAGPPRCTRQPLLNPEDSRLASHGSNRSIREWFKQAAKGLRVWPSKHENR